MSFTHFDPIDVENIPVKTKLSAKVAADTLNGMKPSSSSSAAGQEPGARSADYEDDNGRWSPNKSNHDYPH